MALPDRRIVIVGWRQSNNGRTCPNHPEGCGQRWHTSGAVGHKFKLERVEIPGETALACREIKHDGSLGCHVAFAQRQFAHESIVGYYDGATIKIQEMYGDWSTAWGRSMNKQNFGYAPAEVVEFGIPGNQSQENDDENNTD